MQKLGFQSRTSLDQFKCLSGSISRTSKTVSMMAPRPSSDSHSTGSFGNLKITAEKLLKEQASVKSDLEMANLKLKKSMDHLHLLEEKLQHAYNENAKLRVKQKEDDKLWKGLDSKFSSTKTVCDQLTETLQYLADQVQHAEKDKEIIENKLSESSQVIEVLHHHMNSLSSKLETAQETTLIRENELKELRTEKDEREASFKAEECKVIDLIKVKDAEIVQFEATVAENNLAIESLNSKLGELHLELKSNEDRFQNLGICHENLQKEKSDLQVSRADFANKLAKALQEIEGLEELSHALAENIIQLDKCSLYFSDKFLQLTSVQDILINLLGQERDLSAKHAKKQYSDLHNQFLRTSSEKDGLHSLNLDLKSKVCEIQKVQEFVMVQHAEECRVAEEKIQYLESEIETLISKKAEMEKLVFELEEKNEKLSESSRLLENNVKDLGQKLSTIEFESKDNIEKLQAEIQKNSEETDVLRREIGKHEQHVTSMESQISQLDRILEEKENIIQQHKDREKKLEFQNTEIQASLDSAERKLADDKKQYDLKLENKQLELSNHLKEISQRNDQAINDIRKKFEVERLEIVNLEKEKVEKLIKEVERRCEEKLSECREESKQNLLRIQEEHDALVIRIQQEHDRKEESLKASSTDELRRVQLQAENELREKMTQLRNEHEVQMKALRDEHEDEYTKLQEELHVQKSKEERQRALLQLQWKVMGDKPQEDQEVNSKKSYSVSKINNRNRLNGERGQHAQRDKENKASPFVKGSQTPVAGMQKKAEEVNTASMMNAPKHRKMVTRREYEVETSNGQTTTKRRKTKSTVMYAEPRKNKTLKTPTTKTPRSIVKGTKAAELSRPSFIGDLFSEGSLNPYADDPYAFD